MFRSRRDADLTIDIQRRIPVLKNDSSKDGNPWKIEFKYVFRNANDAEILQTRKQLEGAGWLPWKGGFTRDNMIMLPLYEGKMAHLFDHRWNTCLEDGSEEFRRISIGEKADPETAVRPRYWVQRDGYVDVKNRGRPARIPGVEVRLQDAKWGFDWLVGWRDVARPTDERTAIPAFVPRVAASHTFPLMLPRVSPILVSALVAAQSSLVFDFVGRQKVGGIHMSLMTWKQLPVPAPKLLEPHTPFITPRVLELVYTASDMAGLARDLDDTGGPFRWDEERRAQIRAELDAYFFHLYGIGRPDVDYIMETFQTENGGLKHNDIAKYGTYRTKDLVLAEYDRMTPAGVSLDVPLIDGKNYTSTLTPPPGHGPRHPEAPA